MMPTAPSTAPPPPVHPDASVELIDDLRATGADFHQRGWSLATSSNYSLVLGRDPLELLITVSGKDKGRLGRDDFVRVGADGAPVDGCGKKSSAETMLHVVLADELAGVNAVLHTHSAAVTVASSLAGDCLVLEGYEMLKALDGVTTHESRVALRVFENTQDIATLAQEVRAWLRSGEGRDGQPQGFVLRKHGLYTWGASLAAARAKVEAIEFLLQCEVQHRVLAAATPDQF